MAFSPSSSCRGMMDVNVNQGSSKSVGLKGLHFGDVVPITTHTPFVTSISHRRPSTQLFGFFDDLMKGFEQGGDNDDQNKSKKGGMEKKNDDEQELNEADFVQELKRRRELDTENASANSNKIVASNVMTKQDEEEDEDSEFDGYALRDAIYNKWGQCFDVDFQPVTTFGFRELYLNVMPFRLGGKRFRHKTELDYLCHLQAVVEILVKYEQLDYVLSQLEETTKKPRAGTSPLVAVPFRLDLTEEELNSILQ
eukprot:CAMPEP_0204632720 /NCGR_PEP_ID=MMETSP0717-20131115/25483_1 /ASSEMBLY_ACC=CAM_ASM_000666 /TAXON_ID=230516 /ORGANISM="Chaetoceros curvisetus" /LENGTH=252 /DNA_ID=CAMNT_0051650631 /DNA_START=119 /DNA_END=877 /DNA_ORIENTATION=-